MQLKLAAATDPSWKTSQSTRAELTGKQRAGTFTFSPFSFYEIAWGIHHCKNALLTQYLSSNLSTSPLHLLKRKPYSSCRIFISKSGQTQPFSFCLQRPRRPWKVYACPPRQHWFPEGGTCGQSMLLMAGCIRTAGGT